MIVLSTNRKIRSRPRNTYLLKANAAIELMTSVKSVAPAVTTTLFNR